jgi:ribosomal-protein-serine acetyltransferase
MNRSAREPLPLADRKTDRFVLRPFRRRDIDALYRAVRASKTELARFLPWATRTYTRASAASFVKESIQSWREARAYDFAIRRPDRRGRHIGNVSIWHVSRTFRSGEIGYWIRTEETGLGIATEVTRAALQIGFEELNMHRLILRIALGNSPSERIAGKLGFVREGVLREEIKVGSRWLDHSVWGLLDHEYRRNNGAKP